MFGFNETKQQMQDLLSETRAYVGLQKKALLMETRDKLSIILSRLAIAVVCLVLGGMVLLFFSFFLAYIIGQAMDNIALGFAIVSAIVLVLLLVFWMLRGLWVVRPITTMLYNLFTVDEKPIESEAVREELHATKDRMSMGFAQLTNNKGKKTASKVETISNFVGRGFALYEGLRIAFSVFRAFGNVFGSKKRRRR